MGKKKENEVSNLVVAPFNYSDHPTPFSRRQLLANGTYGFCGYMVMPSLITMLTSQVAYGVDCAAGQQAGAARMASFICVDLVGGGNIAGGNVIVGKEDDQKKLLANGGYATLGLSDAIHPSVTGKQVNEFGLLFHADSAMLAGMREVTDPATRANVDGMVFCTKSADDTQNNEHNPVYWIANAGLKGELTTLIGQAASASGGRSGSPASSINPSISPVTIARPADVGSIVDQGRLGTLLRPDEAEAVIKAAQSMSGEKLKRFNAKTLPAQIRDLVDCGYMGSVDLLTKYSATGLSPANDPLVSNATTGAFKDFATNPLAANAASIAKTVIDGYAGAGTIALGGYDYHGSTQLQQAAKDREAGRIIGQLLELARLKNQDLMVYVFSDGGVGANGQAEGNKFKFSGDSGDRAASFILVYKKDGKPTITNVGRQVGGFKDNGAIDTAAALTSSSVENTAKAVALNYLALHDKDKDFAKIVGADPFGATIDRYKFFAKLR